MLKVAAILEVKDVTKMTLDDLMRSLRTYEMNLSAQAKDKGIAQKAEVNSSENAPYSEEEITMLTRNFEKILQKLVEHQDLKTLLE